jgi:hypothetical protein
MGDDIGWMQPGIYHRGLMVGETPNIDLSFANNPSVSCRNAFIPMMKAANLCDFDDGTLAPHWPFDRTLFSECQMRTGSVVVEEVCSQDSFQVTGVQNNEVVDTLASNRANQALGIGILPRTVARGENVQRLQSITHLASIHRVPVADQVSGSVSVSKCFHNLLCHPTGGGVLRHIKVQYPPPVCSSTTKTIKTRNRIVGTVKKSTDTI